MRSVVYTRTGDSSVLSLVERPVPEPGEGEVRVRIVVSGVNPTDWKTRRGSGPGETGESVPNQDGAGIVDAVGPSVTSVAVGDRVWLAMSGYGRARHGTAQEYTLALAERVFPLPRGASFDVGASLGVPAVTAHRALTVAEDGPRRLGPGSLTGRVVLIAGGAGAVGHAAIQLVRWAGGTAIATVSSEAKGRLAASAGAHHVVDYRHEDAAARIRAIAPEGVHHVVEVAIGANDELNRAVLRPRGVVAMYANDGDAPLTVAIRPSMELNIRYQFVLVYTMGAEALAAAGEDVAAAVADGALPVGEDAGMPVIRFDLEHTAAAHDTVEGSAVGKVLIDVAN